MGDFEQDLPGESPTPQEAAFRNSTDREYRGRKLEKFSWVRRTAAIALGIRVWKLTTDDLITLKNPRYEALEALKAEKEALEGQEDTPERNDRLAAIMDEMEAIGEQDDEVIIYDGIALDALLVLWLCHQSETVCARARRNPKEYEKEIDRWGEKNEIFVDESMTPNPEALAVFMGIIADIRASQYTPKTGNARTEEKN